jgi:hypothetical protein
MRVLAALAELTHASWCCLPQSRSSPYVLGGVMFSAGELAELSHLATPSGKTTFHASRQFEDACYKLFRVWLKLPRTNKMRDIRKALEWAARLIPRLGVVLPKRRR